MTKLTVKKLREAWGKGGRNKWKDIPPEERSRIMKEAVMKRKYRPVKEKKI